jgi:hypothetical protein
MSCPLVLYRIRQFGFLANRVRKQKLALCRYLLGTLPPDQSARTDSPADGDCQTEQQPRHPAIPPLPGMQDRLVSC